jgi:hypothetical protein
MTLEQKIAQVKQLNQEIHQEQEAIALAARREDTTVGLQLAYDLFMGEIQSRTDGLSATAQAMLERIAILSRELGIPYLHWPEVLHCTTPEGTPYQLHRVDHNRYRRPSDLPVSAYAQPHI